MESSGGIDEGKKGSINSTSRIGAPRVMRPKAARTTGRLFLEVDRLSSPPSQHPQRVMLERLSNHNVDERRVAPLAMRHDSATFSTLERSLRVFLGAEKRCSEDASDRILVTSISFLIWGRSGRGVGREGRQEQGRLPPRGTTS